MKTGIIVGIIIGVMIFLVLILGIAGWGLYNASLAKNYAKEIKSIMAESNHKWTQEKLEEGNYTIEELAKKMEMVKKDCENQLKKLEALKAPKKALTLEKKTKEYFTIAKDVSEKMIKVAEYGKALEGIEKDLGSLTGSSDSIEEFIALFTKFHRTLSGILSDLKSTTPPTAAKNFHKKYTAFIDEYDELVVKAIGYAKKRQIGKLEEVSKEMESLNKEFSKIETPSEDEMLKGIITDEQKDILNKYPTEIDTEANSLMKTLISF